MTERPIEQLQPAEPPPWPIVGECFGHRSDLANCPQCNGGHVHAWVAWRTPDPGVLGASTYGGTLPVRCTHCGARKCDRPACMLRRHHRDDHEDY